MYRNIRKKADGSFIVNFNGLPFHVTTDYPAAELYGEEMTYEAIAAYATEHPEETQEYAEPAFEMPDLTAERQTQLRIAELEKEAQILTPFIQAGIDVPYNRQKLVDILLEIEELKGNL